MTIRKEIQKAYCKDFLEQGSQSSDGVHISSPILDNPNWCEEQEKAMRRAEWAAVRERNLANRNIPTQTPTPVQAPPIQKRNEKGNSLKIQHSIIIAAIIISVAILLAAIISRPARGAKYKAIGNGGMILDSETGEVRLTRELLDEKH